MTSVLVTEEIAQAGVDLLRGQFQVDVELNPKPDDLAGRIGAYDALIVRSATSVSAGLLEHAGNLKVIGRAGTGVDNVDVAAATRRGIIVANAPGSNMVAAAEHAFGLLLAIARNIPQAHAALTQGRWERKRFGGVELADKVLGVVGFGRIGQLVATRARAFEMRVVVFDPFVSAERCRELQVSSATLENLLLQADFVTLHAPLTPETRHLIDAERLHLMKPGVRIVNAARGDLVDIDALAEALRSGHVAGAALDVFPEEPYTAGPILGLQNVVVTPHLGASTQEAQDRAGVIVAEQVAAALRGELVPNAVNIPQVQADEMEVLGPYLPVATQLGRLAVGLCEHGLERIDVTYDGALAEHDTRLLTAAVIMGAFQSRSDEPVNLVNARTVAEARGIAVTEGQSRSPADYTSLIRVSCGDGQTVSGTTIGRENRPWLVEVEGYQLEIELAGHMVVMLNDDRPGIIGRVGTAFGEDGVNIANMSVSRNFRGERAAMVLALDVTPAPAVIEHLSALDGVHHVRSVDLDGAGS
ncbi:MAG TPA: phosphoglycerate dehydrogenase [Gaiellales bacterium]|nr:phosphoglycerate dehydrogenase [Gaiellales bacterium]